MNENLVAITVAALAVLLAYFRLDDGAAVKMVIAAYLGWLMGKRTPQKK